MGVTNVLYDWGFKYEDPKKPYAMQGFVNSPEAVKGLEFYKALYKCCTAPGMTNAYMQEGLDAFKSGQVAMQMNWFAFFPGLYKDPNVGGDKIGFFVNPAEKIPRYATRRPGHLCRFLFQQARRLSAVHQVVRAAGRATEMVGTRRLLSGQVRRQRTRLRQKCAVRTAIPGSPTSIVVDFWAEPAYAELLLDMQKRIHDYVVADKGTAKEALDLLVVDWTKVFKEEGKID